MTSLPTDSRLFVAGHTGAKFAFDTTKTDGTPFKLLSVVWLHRLRWRHIIDLEEGIRSTYDWYLENKAIRWNCSAV